MSVASTVLPLPREAVFAALLDPWTYPHWLVGARDIRAVDDSWPARGSRFHHRVGLVGPLTVADSSEVIDIDPPKHLTLEVRARPLGRGRATFRLHEVPPDPGADVDGCTLLEVEEVPLGSLRRVAALLEPLVAARNRRSLAQLEDLLLHGTSHRFPG